MNEELNMNAAMPELETSKCGEYRPSKQEALKRYEINIKFLDRGCIVKVGCKEIAFEDVNKAVTLLNEYVTNNTYEIQKKWIKLLD
jgi:hypothetical protein